MKKCKICKEKKEASAFTIASKRGCDVCLTERLVLLKERVEMFQEKKKYGLQMERIVVDVDNYDD